MSYFKITLIRSGIGMTKRQNGILAALGLRKRMSIVYHPVSPEVAGKIMSQRQKPRFTDGGNLLLVLLLRTRRGGLRRDDDTIERGLGGIKRARV
jgi:ribosomal protein L30